MTAAREIRRLRYLEALGIVPLVSRRSLPGAAPTRKLRLRAGAAAQKSEAPAAVAHPAADAAGDLRRSFADGTPQRRASARAEITEGAAAVGKPPVSPAERFSLAVFHAGPDLWIEELADPVLAREQVELVAAMARALAHPQVSVARSRNAPGHDSSASERPPSSACSAWSLPARASRCHRRARCSTIRR